MQHAVPLLCERRCLNSKAMNSCKAGSQRLQGQSLLQAWVKTDMSILNIHFESGQTLAYLTLSHKCPGGTAKLVVLQDLDASTP